MTKPVTISRAPLSHPLTPTEEIVVTLLATARHNYQSIAEQLGVSPKTVKRHAENAAMKISSDLPTQIRCVAWYRGASPEVLSGEHVRRIAYQSLSEPG